MTESALDVLRALAGTWVGDGLEVKWEGLPNAARRRVLRGVRTREAIAFAPFGEPPTTRQRPGGVDATGVYYVHHATEVASGRPLFLEPGVWVATEASPRASLARIATLRGQHAVLTVGYRESIAGAPEIPSARTQPVEIATGRVPTVERAGAAEARQQTELAPGILEDPNTILRDQSDAQRITATSILTIEGRPGTERQVPDAPFTGNNPQGIWLKATFWIETFAGQGGGNDSMQLQYSQAVVRIVDGIGWPSVSVATLVRR